MIKINLLAEKKQTKVRKAPSAVSLDATSGGGMRNLILIAILLVGVVISGVWWYSLSSRTNELTVQHRAADRELERLKEIRRKGEEFKAKKVLLARKIDLITELKRRQSVPVHILDQISKNLPEYLWLESMSATHSQVNIAGKATNYNAVSSFYQNLSDSGYFGDVELGRTFAVREGVSFSLTCRFADPGGSAESQS